MININDKKLCEACFAETDRDPCPECGFSKSTYKHDSAVLGIGSILEGRYLIGKTIGKGGFGITYLAYDVKMRCKVAIKEYYPYGIAVRGSDTKTVNVTSSDSKNTFEEGASKFYEEARLVAGFNGNPNIVSVYDFFYGNDTVYFTMGYLKGVTLKAYIEKNGMLSVNQAVRVAGDMCNALMAAHSRNVLHRDISPDNIMVCYDGTIKLLDFGAARQVISDESRSLSVILKQGFAPLEQYQKKGKQGPWTDIYSLGATIYYALTGAVLDDPMTRLDEDDEFQSNPYNIPEELWKIIQKATMLKMRDRYQDVFELKEALDELSIAPEPLVVVDYKAQAAKFKRSSGEDMGAAAAPSAVAATELAKQPSQPAEMGKTTPVKQPSQPAEMGVTTPVKQPTAPAEMGVTMPMKQPTELEPAPEIDKQAERKNWTCSSCGTLNFKTSTQCCKCGEKYVRLPAGAKLPNSWKCSVCGADNSGYSSFCMECNAPKKATSGKKPDSMGVTMPVKQSSQPAETGMTTPLRQPESEPQGSVTTLFKDTEQDKNETDILAGESAVDAYERKVKAKRKRNIIIGSILGAIALVIATIIIIYANQEYYYTTKYGEIYITSYNGKATEVVIPSEINGKPVVAIGDRAFCDNKTINSVVIPEGVTKIGENAFFVCDNLESVTLPDGITEIGDFAFYSCVSLTKVELPDSVTRIGSSAFDYCKSLNYINIPDGVTSIGESAFSWCYELTAIDLPNSVTEIGNSAFEYSGVIRVTLSNNITVIPDSAFYGCDNLENITIPNGVKTIEDNAFRSCDSLTSVRVPDSVKSIGDDAFTYCLNLTSISVPEGCDIDDKAFEYTNAKITYRKVSQQAEPSSPTEPSQPAVPTDTTEPSQLQPEQTRPSQTDRDDATDSSFFAYKKESGAITIVGYNGEPGYSDIYTDIVIPSVIEGLPVVKIGEYAFYSIEVNSVIVPDSVTQIGDYAFSDCKNLTEVSIPAGCEIADGVFNGSDNVKIIYRGAGSQQVEPERPQQTPTNTTTTARPVQTEPVEIDYSKLYEYEDHHFYSGLKITKYIGNEQHVEIPSYIDGKKVIMIEYKAFYGCNSIKSVVIPSTVTEINFDAFMNCPNLTSVTIPDSVERLSSSVFQDCTSLTSITIPDSIGMIAVDMFKNCTSLKTVELPDTMTQITQGAFNNCTSLTNINIPYGVTEIGGYAFWGCAFKQINIPNTVTSIGYNAFTQCDNLTSIYIPDSVKSIGTNALGYCDKLTEASLPSGCEYDDTLFLGSNKVKITIRGAGSQQAEPMEVDYSKIFQYQTKNGSITITNYIGKGTSKLVIPSEIDGKPVTEIGDGESAVIPEGTSITELVISKGVKRINEGAFDKSSLESVTIPSSVTHLGDLAFYHCSKLKSVTIPNSVTYVGNSAFVHCDSLKSITVPSSVTNLGRYAFSSCVNLESATLDCRIDAIKEGTFSGCVSLTSVKFPKNLIRIENSAFSHTALTDLVLPETVTNIYSNAFYSCEKLKSVQLSSVLREIGDTAFNSCNNLSSIYIPDSVEKIRSKAFANCDKLTDVSIPSSCEYDNRTSSRGTFYNSNNVRIKIRY